MNKIKGLSKIKNTAEKTSPQSVLYVLIGALYIWYYAIMIYGLLIVTLRPKAATAKISSITKGEV